jgi:hypothetical protein
MMYRTVSILLLAFLLHSCANYKLNYVEEAKNWQEEDLPPQDSVVQHSIYLIGDTGNSNLQPDFFEYLKKNLADAPEESTIVFLGDNIYPVGMPPKEMKDYRRIVEEKLDIQLDALSDFKGKVLFVPGNHDWMQYGLQGLQRQEKYIENKLQEMFDLTDDEAEITFLPDEGCNDPEVIEIGDKLVIVAIDSQWWLEDWDDHPRMHSDCDIRNRETFLYYFEETLRKYRTRNVVIVQHHPIFSNGSHGGFLTAKDHIFPLTQYLKKSFVPIPFLGSLGLFLRRRGAIKQDLSHPLYRDLRYGELGAATKNGSYIFAAGHEHNLQYWEKEGQTFIVSGSGSKENPVRAGDGALFAYAKRGFARLDFYEDGSAWVYYYAPSKNGEHDDLVYRRKVKDKLEIFEELEDTEVEPFDNSEKFKTVPPITTEVHQPGWLTRPIAGKHYRDVYLEKYDFPTLDLNEYKGGVFPVKMGGGRQTNSMRLERADGQQYSMRALTKDATRLLPYPANEITLAQYITQDIFLSTHPFGALTIPPLAAASKVYHTNPEYYYVPKQPALQEYNAYFGDEVYLMEERPDDDGSKVASFGNSKDIISTPKMIDKLISNQRHKVEQDWVVRARLFDMVIGDWDRHDDQWRFATFDVGDEGGIETYRPIPRDRDQVFPNYDGLLVGIARFAQPILRQLTPYEDNIKSLKWAVFNARHFDNSFMNELEWEDWKREVEFLQANLTDAVIDSAFLQVRPDQQELLQFDKIASTMKKRRDNLMDIAKRFYAVTAKQVDIVGTNDKEIYVVSRNQDGSSLVQAYAKKQDTVVYQRLFLPDETKEIHIYGLEDDDQFLVQGTAEEAIKVRIIGGLGADEMVDNSNIAGLERTTIYYDFATEDNSVLSKFGELKDEQSTVVERNRYDRKHPHYDFNFTRPLPLIGFNPDEGLSVGLNLLTHIYNFKKSPYGQLHSLSATYLAALGSFDFEYQGDFLSVVKQWDITTRARGHGDRFAFNYFGLGNDTENPMMGLEFNRTRESQILLDIRLRRRALNDLVSFSIGPFVEQIIIRETEGRFINTLELPEELFEPRRFAGINTELNIDGVDNILSPRRGARFNLGYSYQYNITDSDRSFNNLNSQLSIYFPIGKGLRTVFATRVGTDINFEETDFFKQPFIGGNTNLRGFRAERFRGDATFYHNSDLRVKVLESINRTLPFSLGLHAGFDHGRVWLRGEDSDTWHYSYGGGIWLAPVNMFIVSVGVYKSEEQFRALATVGHLF